jgi:transcriptional regulator with XRE-family HTH domain
MPKPRNSLTQGTDARERNAFEATLVLFGENLRQARIKAGLTQRAVEAQTKIKQAYISQVEGGRQNLTLQTVITLARAVDEDFLTLLQRPASTAKPK